MPEYQVIARKFRPQTFKEVVGQNPTVTALKNAIRMGRLSHAYLFCGSRGTGKTTLARVLAKAINCPNRSEDFEPCNECQSCKEITGGHSLDVLEIDGASHRGIDDIRKINETVGYATASGGYKIFIIDEVHMLTKEAFNALLKTLEEPPPRVKFFFATTEAHKVLPTILSRCQRFNLSRISAELIINKLRQISNEMNVTIDDESLRIIAGRAEGGLRDAESILDQIVAFKSDAVTVEDVNAIFGLMPRDSLFELDIAGKKGELSKAFEVADQVYSQGKDLLYFVEMLMEHVRHLLQVKINGGKHFPETLSMDIRKKYIESGELYTKEQCLGLLDYLVEAQQKIRFAPSTRIALEVILLAFLRSHQKVPVETLIRKITALEEKMGQQPATAPQPQNYQVKKEPAPVVPKAKPVTKEPAPVVPTAKPITKEPTPIELGARPTPEAKAMTAEQNARYDTLMQFAAVELEGTVKKNTIKR